MTTLVVRNQDGIKLLAELEASGAVTSTGLTLPHDLPWTRYAALAGLFGQLHRTSAFLLGDLLNFGEKIYGETYTQVCALTGLADSTLMNYASVCRYVPLPLRRQELSFSHHAEVAYLKPEVQRSLLDKAVENDWNRSTLRDEVAPFRDKQSQVEWTPGIPEAEGTPALVVCSCMTCGRLHYTDRDVVDPASISV